MRLRANVFARVGATAAVGAGVTAATKAGAASVGIAEVGSAAGAAGIGAVTNGSLGALVGVAAKVLAALAVVGLATAGYVTLSTPGRTIPSGKTAPVMQTVTPSLPSRTSAGSPRERAPDPEQATAAPPVLAPEVRDPRPIPCAESNSPTPPVLLAPAVPPRVGAPSSLSPASHAAPTSDMGEETRALAVVLATLRDGHAEQALSALDDQDSRFSDGVLGEERAATRIDALCMLRRTSEARAMAARFLREHPRSVYAPRVKASCGVE
jgi:hypothetical protein